MVRMTARSAATKEKLAETISGRLHAGDVQRCSRSEGPERVVRLFNSLWGAWLVVIAGATVYGKFK
jgi:hypothetical protein